MKKAAAAPIGYSTQQCHVKIGTSLKLSEPPMHDAPGLRRPRFWPFRFPP